MQQLSQSHPIGLTWFIFGGVGVLSAILIYLYGLWMLKLARRQQIG